MACKCHRWQYRPNAFAQASLFGAFHLKDDANVLWGKSQQGTSIRIHAGRQTHDRTAFGPMEVHYSNTGAKDHILALLLGSRARRHLGYCSKARLEDTGC